MRVLHICACLIAFFAAAFASPASRACHERFDDECGFYLWQAEQRESAAPEFVELADEDACYRAWKKEMREMRKTRQNAMLKMPATHGPSLVAETKRALCAEVEEAAELTAARLDGMRCELSPLLQHGLELSMEAAKMAEQCEPVEVEPVARLSQAEAYATNPSTYAPWDEAPVANVPMPPEPRNFHEVYPTLTSLGHAAIGAVSFGELEAARSESIRQFDEIRCRTEDFTRFGSVAIEDVKDDLAMLVVELEDAAMTSEVAATTCEAEEYACSEAELLGLLPGPQFAAKATLPVEADELESTAQEQHPLDADFVAMLELAEQLDSLGRSLQSASRNLVRIVADEAIARYTNDEYQPWDTGVQGRWQSRVKTGGNIR